MNEEFQKEISLVLLVNHKNVVKLFGLCSETKMPLLVYEFISKGNLFKNIDDKLKVAFASFLGQSSKDSIGDYPCAWLSAFSSRPSNCSWRCQVGEHAFRQQLYGKDCRFWSLTTDFFRPNHHSKKNISHF